MSMRCATSLATAVLVDADTRCRRRWAGCLANAAGGRRDAAWTAGRAARAEMPVQPCHPPPEGDWATTVAWLIEPSRLAWRASGPAGRPRRADLAAGEEINDADAVWLRELWWQAELLAAGRGGRRNEPVMAAWHPRHLARGIGLALACRADDVGWCRRARTARRPAKQPRASTRLAQRYRPRRATICSSSAAATRRGRCRRPSWAVCCSPRRARMASGRPSGGMRPMGRACFSSACRLRCQPESKGETVTWRRRRAQPGGRTGGWWPGMSSSSRCPRRSRGRGARVVVCGHAVGDRAADFDSEDGHEVKKAVEAYGRACGGPEATP